MTPSHPDSEAAPPPSPSKNPIQGVEGLHPQRPQPYSTIPLGQISLTRKGRTLCRSFVDSRSELPPSFPGVFWNLFFYSTLSDMRVRHWRMASRLERKLSICMWPSYSVAILYLESPSQQRRVLYTANTADIFVAFALEMKSTWTRLWHL